MNARLFLSGTLGRVTKKRDLSPNLGKCEKAHENWGKDRFIRYSFKSYLLSIYYVRGTVLGKRHSKKEADMMPILKKHPKTWTCAFNSCYKAWTSASQS